MKKLVILLLIVGELFVLNWLKNQVVDKTGMVNTRAHEIVGCEYRNEEENVQICIVLKDDQLLYTSTTEEKVIPMSVLYDVRDVCKEHQVLIQYESIEENKKVSPIETIVFYLETETIMISNAYMYSFNVGNVIDEIYDILKLDE